MRERGGVKMKGMAPWLLGDRYRWSRLDFFLLLSRGGRGEGQLSGHHTGPVRSQGQRWVCTMTSLMSIGLKTEIITAARSGVCRYGRLLYSAPVFFLFFI